MERGTAIQCNNLIYANGKTSVCFADYFLTAAAGRTGLSIQRSFHSVKLDSDQVFDSPFTVISGKTVHPERRYSVLSWYPAVATAAESHSGGFSR